MCIVLVIRVREFPLDARSNDVSYVGCESGVCVVCVGFATADSVKIVPKCTKFERTVCVEGECGRDGSEKE